MGMTAAAMRMRCITCTAVASAELMCAKVIARTVIARTIGVMVAMAMMSMSIGSGHIMRKSRNREICFAVVGALQVLRKRKRNGEAQQHPRCATQRSEIQRCPK